MNFDNSVYIDRIYIGFEINYNHCWNLLESNYTYNPFGCHVSKIHTFGLSFS
jgi:hypothetical protein